MSDKQIQSDAIRRDQVSDGVRRTLTVPETRRQAQSQSQPKKPFVAKGHDAILKAAQDVGKTIIITKMGDGSQTAGKLVARDKFTITIQTQDGRRITFYKHAIESFEPVQVQ